MKRIFLVGVSSLAVAVALSGCAGFTVPGLQAGATTANNALTSFLSDPNCAHHDEATYVSGAAGVPASFQAKVARDCPAHAAVIAPVAPASGAGGPT